LALAYAYDRSGKIDKARVELRYIIDAALLALPKIEAREKAYDDRYWDYQIVAAEAIEHLRLISKAKADAERIDKLRPKLKSPEKIWLYFTPIFVPLNGASDVQAFVDNAASVAFDLSGQGLPLRGGWIRKDAAWLVWDPGNEQMVQSGVQLFGSVTWATPWETGFRALAALDDNGDGKIAGDELGGLALWRDANANGISEKGEVMPVADWNIVALGYGDRRVRRDLWVSAQGVTFSNGETRPTYDWVIRSELVTASRR
jgi:hypothetical protein